MIVLLILMRSHKICFYGDTCTFVEITMYRKNSKNWDTIMITVIVLKVEPYGFTLPECIRKGGDGIANSVDPDQTAP